jgi:uncharacterized protein YkwD
MNIHPRVTQVLLLLLVAVALAAKPGAAHAATVAPRTALLYRINQVRAKHHLAAVYPSPQLRLVASHHSDDMLVRDYFAHTSPRGSTLASRIANSGFVAGYAWLGGETLAWGTGTLATPLSTVRAWLASPEHRAIMLSPTYRWVGISRACGHFLGHTGACVWTADWVKRW